MTPDGIEKLTAETRKWAKDAEPVYVPAGGVTMTIGFNRPASAIMTDLLALISSLQGEVERLTARNKRLKEANDKEHHRLTRPRDRLARQMARDRNALGQLANSLTPHGLLIAHMPSPETCKAIRGVPVADVGDNDPAEASLAALAGRMGKLESALRIWQKAFEWVGADAFDGMDPEGRSLMEHASSNASLALLRPTEPSRGDAG